ncbi:cytochrome c maturation protein CcmE [Alginatibacterium sediminis]|uniref:Cytochrome c-type biogenesis protein CcmE n=1 Tax=Alginatibacterium sediminis TaxID=2164068 RepID=A0A420EFN0_9ALTE|nr:cytochrome c maturation protein CcmE [Alginatibacterium sediminis]RKF19509.1 cytochrome c maturation protein CcmE [Alginatibacterium sediminis]
MTPRRKKRLTIVVAVVAGLSLSIGLLLYALGQNIDLFYTPTELVQGKGKDKIRPEVGQRLRIGGLVVPGTLERSETSLEVRFGLIDAGGELVTVSYDGILPDLFREGQGIVANGELVSAREIKAHEVLAKHDEEYMPPEVAEALKGMDHLKLDYSAEQLEGSMGSKG